MLDRLGSKSFLVPHVVQLLAPTMNWGDPVSKSAVKFCGGVPSWKVVYHCWDLYLSQSVSQSELAL